MTCYLTRTPASPRPKPRAAMLAASGCRSVAGGQFVWPFGIQSGTDTSESRARVLPLPDSLHRNLAAFLRNHSPSSLRALTEGLFSYSITRHMASSDLFFDIIDVSRKVGCPIESWHTKSGPGVFESVSPSFRIHMDSTLIFILSRRSKHAKLVRWRTESHFSSGF